ncbi:MAG: serine/threonine protein kinase [Deltaproteobacteria bacterium]|nr:serine/threonine protein kinase [Deltaproteobacteria bacterium]
MPAPTPGATIPLPRGESFQIGRVLGTGGMGTVVEAMHAPSGRRVALKFLHDELLDHPTIPQRFAREVDLATSLTTAHVARTFGLERTPQGTPFMIMELLDGRDLNGLIRGEGKLSPARAARIISQACEALEEAHARGIVHRDLKPENLFVTVAADGTDWVKVLDFGISKVADDGAEAGKPKLTRVGTTVGTPEYMAPEQLRGAKDLDGSADVYSLGCVLYEALSGRRPFSSPRYEELVRLICTTDAAPLQQLRGDLPPAFCDVVARAMARDRKARIQTARALRDALAPWASSRRSEGTVVMEPSGPTSGPGRMSPMPHSGPRPSAPSAPVPAAAPARVAPAPAVRGGTHPDATIVDDGPDGGGSKTWVVVLISSIVLLLAGGAALFFFGHDIGLH